MIKYIEFGNIFQLPGVLNYAHGCNCAGAMGKGIALQFKHQFPDMYARYKDLCSAKQFNLGDIYAYNYGQGYVFNLGTQQTWKTKAQLPAIEQSITKMCKFAAASQVKEIALPKIGAGLGGLNWTDVKALLEKVFGNYPQIDFYIVENFSA